jgi:SAM-dependent methyltransferase
VTAPAEWFRDWFGDAYLSLYPHRDQVEAGAGVSLFLRKAAPAQGCPVLDLGCGVGRHVGFLNEAGHLSVGLDLSARLLLEARRVLGSSGRLVRGDMRRLPFRKESFGAVVNFFTSFGYFASPGEDRVYFERVRMYEPDQLSAMLDAHGLVTTARFGDYDGSSVVASSPRLLLVGRAG